LNKQNSKWWKYISASMVTILYNSLIILIILLLDVTGKMYTKDFNIYVTQVIVKLKNWLNKRFLQFEKSNTNNF
jgi:hypothetical protein